MLCTARGLGPRPALARLLQLREREQRERESKRKAEASPSLLILAQQQGEGRGLVLHSAPLLQREQFQVDRMPDLPLSLYF